MIISVLNCSKKRADADRVRDFCGTKPRLCVPHIFHTEFAKSLLYIGLWGARLCSSPAAGIFLPIFTGRDFCF